MNKNIYRHVLVSSKYVSLCFFTLDVSLVKEVSYDLTMSAKDTNLLWTNDLTRDEITEPF